MERPYPMDRIICGDVGYGKTEIAIRAAFKAVQDGKQVAVLVPTTLLVQQHTKHSPNAMQDFRSKLSGSHVLIARKRRRRSLMRLSTAALM
jgi:transcription-repair coupling factor (superfamily II helicase)